MEIVAKELQFVSANVGETHRMEVDSKKHAKLFRMLSDGLYSDKQTAIIGELCSNARDSHRDAGMLDAPFAIVAPSDKEPTLRVQDIGLGLSYEMALSSILMFLGSTKDEGVDAKFNVGGFGIGAKSPRAYSSTYEMILRKDGMEWHILVFDDEDGLPTHTVLQQRKTHHRNGVEMIVPIKREDVNEWRGKVKSYMEKTNYNVIAYFGDGEVVLPKKPNKVFEFDGWYLDVFTRYNTWHSSEKAIPVTYGGKQYDIPPAMSLLQRQHNITKLLAPGHDIRIRVEDPQALTFALSREVIEVTDKNFEFLHNALETLENDVKKASNQITHQGRTVTTWKGVLQASEEYQARLQEAKDSTKLGSIVNKIQAYVTFAPVGLQKSYYNGSKYGLKDVVTRVVLPVTSESCAVQDVGGITVCYSDGRPTIEDYYNATGLMRLICPIKTDSEDEARKWAESLDAYESLALRYEYVESTRKEARRQKSDHVLVVKSKLTEKPIKISPRSQYVVIDDLSQGWAILATSAVVILPDCTKAKREKLMGMPNVMTLEKFMEEDGHKEFIKNLHGVDTSEDRIYNIKQMEDWLREKQRERMANWPESVKSDFASFASTCAEVRARVHRAWEVLEQLHAWEKILSAKFNLPEIPAFDTLSLLKRGNELTHLFNVWRDTFRCVNFNRLQRQAEEGNDKAELVMKVLNLEQFK